MQVQDSFRQSSKLTNLHQHILLVRKTPRDSDYRSQKSR